MEREQLAISLARGGTAAARLATILDQEMLERRGVTISARVICDEQLPVKSGVEVFGELGGRFLVRYLLRESLSTCASGTDRPVYVTPTPYTPTDAVALLMLPSEDRPREHAMLIDPRYVDKIAGPRWVQGGFGIEYILPRGYQAEAVAIRPWTLRLD